MGQRKVVLFGICLNVGIKHVDLKLIAKLFRKLCLDRQKSIMML